MRGDGVVSRRKLGRRAPNDMLAPPRLIAVTLSPGDLIDQKYRILRMLGTGGMGSVYEAENTRVDRRVAIKVMHKVRDQQDITRFEREARAAQIGSSNIVQVFDLGYLADGAPYMVMEYLAGETLGERLQRSGALNAAELLPIAVQILDALGAAHRNGIIHRDLKPDNVFLARLEGSDQEVVKLLDFGISKFTEAARKPPEMSLTKSGVAVGTPHYMSPEQVQGSKSLDTRTDLYSLGVILYRCLAGQLPFQSDDVAPLLVQILLESPKPLHEVAPHVDPAMSAIVARAMARRAEDRFQTAQNFRSALASWEKSRSAPGDTKVPAEPNATLLQPPQLQIGTNPSWSSTASAVPEAKRTLRHVLLALVFSLAGFVGLFVAYQLWMGGKSHPPVEAAGGPVAAPLIASVAPASSPPAISVVPVRANAGPALAAPKSPHPALPTSRAGTSQVAAAPVVPVVITSSAPLIAPGPSVVPPTPVVGPAKAAVATEEDVDNRHMSRGVH